MLKAKFISKIHPIIWMIILISIAGSIAIVYSTRWGPWAYSDSTEYIVSARTFISGRGLGFYAPSGSFERLSLHPPFYSLLLSAFGLLGIDMLAAARWLNVFLFGATIFLAGVFAIASFAPLAGAHQAPLCSPCNPDRCF
jgi:hypothetical protein